MTVHNLPTQPTPFVGRVQELEDVARLLADPNCRLVTLLGPGGIGKSRLALQAAADESARFADGASYVPLACWLPHYSAPFSFRPMPRTTSASNLSVS